MKVAVAAGTEIDNQKFKPSLKKTKDFDICQFTTDSQYVTPSGYGNADEGQLQGKLKFPVDPPVGEGVPKRLPNFAHCDPYTIEEYKQKDKKNGYATKHYERELHRVPLREFAIEDKFELDPLDPRNDPDYVPDINEDLPPIPPKIFVEVPDMRIFDFTTKTEFSVNVEKYLVDHPYKYIDN